MKKTLIRGGVVIPMDKPGTTVADVLIEDDKIAAIGPDLGASGATVIDASGSVVMPGFIDTHRHMWQGSLRGTAGNDTFGQYFGRAVVGYASQITADDTYVGDLLAALEAIESGTTSILNWAHAVNSPEHADASIRALTESGIRGVYAYGPPGDDAQGWWTASTMTHPEDARRVRKDLLSDDHGRVTMALAIRGPEFSTMETVASDIAFARELGLRCTMHIGIPGLYHQHDSIKSMAAAGLLGNDLTFVHANAFDAEDLKLIAESGGSLSFSPEVELQMGFGWPPLGLALAAGIRPSISVDVITAVGGDVREQARHLLQVSRGLDNQAAIEGGAAPEQLNISTWDALDFVTAQGAKALGLADRTGTLEVGKKADVIVIDTSSFNLSPLNDAVSQVALASHPGNVKTVIIDGNVVKENGVITSIDQATQKELKRRGAEAARRIIGG